MFAISACCGLHRPSARSFVLAALMASIRPAAFVNLLSVHALMNWPAYGSYSATEAACLSAAQCMRAETAPGRGFKVVNVFFGPLETEWFQTVPPPKVTPAALADAVVRALQRGLEDVFAGDVAEDSRQRLAVNPKALEREMAN